MHLTPSCDLPRKVSRMHTTSILILAFWLCTALMMYAYAVYPLLIGTAARIFGRPETPPLAEEETPPRLSILIAAHNEQAVIEDRIRNALALDYPTDRLEIVVASDGSTDQTEHLVGLFADRGVRLIAFPSCRGKSAVLNDCVPRLSGEIVLFSDANTEMDPAAARRLVRWFGDPEVGAVVGRLILVDPATGRNADGLYWKYETYLKTQEAALGALLGANGAIYAMRKEDFSPIPNETIVDDFVIPLLAQIRTGYRLVYDREATATEEAAPCVASEFRRRARIGAGGFQSLSLLYPLLDPRRGWVALALWSHKLLRWCGPFFLLAMLVSSSILAARQDATGVPLVAFQFAFYAVAASADLWPGIWGRNRVVRLANMFTLMNAALFVGFCRWVRGSQSGAWKRTTRSVEMETA